MTASSQAMYPETRAARDAWILERRPQRNTLDPARPYAFFVEDEYSSDGEIVPVATVFLTNRECPWHCLMCDLWQNTLTTSVATGAIPMQVEYALQQLPTARQIKLYNSGSFFDPRAIPVEDYAAIAELVKDFERVIVESHPTFIGENCFRLRDQFAGKLEVAMGLETAHPQILERLNKGMTLDQFAAAASKLQSHGIDLRAFILVKPPFMQQGEALEWAQRSLDFAFACGATAAILIPTRAGNGALDELALLGDFAPPELATVEAAAAYGLSLHKGRVFVDLWDGNRRGSCPLCYLPRMERLRRMNLEQLFPKSIWCESCEAQV